MLGPGGLVRRLAVVLAALFRRVTACAQSSHQRFESGRVRPLALTPDGLRPVAIDTPDASVVLAAA
jgi:hypothetical protein